MLLFVLVALTFTCTQGIFTTGPALYQVSQPVDHSEGPIWDSRKGLLYFVNIHAGQLLNYNYFTGDINAITLGGDVSIVCPTSDDPNVLLVANNRSVVSLEWDGAGDTFTGFKIVTTVAEDFPTSRLNDGKADVDGRLWFGTMGFETQGGDLRPNEGALYYITKDNLANPQVVVSPVNVSNGLAWNSDNTKFYYIDSPSRRIVEYSFDEEAGTISSPRVAFDLSAYEQLAGVPDGMTIDTDDNLWIALYNGGAVIKVDPANGTLLQTIAIPAQCVTSVMFGGPNYGVLFVTSSRYSLTPEQKLQQPAAGAVFAITNTGSYGVEVYRAKID